MASLVSSRSGWWSARCRPAVRRTHRVRSRTSAVWSAPSGRVAFSNRLRTCPNPVFTSSQAAVPSAMPMSRSSAAVPSTTEPRNT